MRCAVFASGGGSNFQALIDRRATGDLHVDFAVLVTNNSKSGAAERARTHSIPVAFLAPSRFPDEATYARELLSALEAHGAELLILAGYMKKLPPEAIARYRNRIVNIHPALLPAFGGQGMYGERVHQAVIDYGARLTGVTVHLVDEEYDHGPILAQEAVPVLDGDDAHRLAARVLKVEHAVYWKAVEDLVQGRVRIVNHRAVRNV